MSTTVTTQKELDAAIESGVNGIVIYSAPGVRLQLRETSHVVARGSSCIDAWNSPCVDAWDSSRVTVWDMAHVRLRSTTAIAIVGGRFAAPVRP